LAHELYSAVQEQGHGKCGTQALMLALEKMSGVEIKRPCTDTSPRTKS
jgi:3-hydroxyisobutyrate dehydrogenase